MERLFCWRCDRVVALFDEQEWALLEPPLSSGLRAIHAYRETHGAPLLAVPMREMYGGIAALARR